ncbi:uncharacterized protein PgNI_06832 [Pyricularia grisea]|uniref:Uncharacterized protein n=1 Tax=Pyricularia grisea TaxID=148305 RepID=A0A6P8B2J2_PYRGI|nr:uncharacterized protein PgNI_06832 [Pyricularia grisea]TLD09076.1 hypothetical protein PgNI_06832 [Pyricularia grisea]
MIPARSSPPQCKVPRGSARANTYVDEPFNLIYSIFERGYDRRSCADFSWGTCQMQAIQVCPASRLPPDQRCGRSNSRYGILFRIPCILGHAAQCSKGVRSTYLQLSISSAAKTREDATWHQRAAASWWRSISDLEHSYLAIAAETD